MNRGFTIVELLISIAIFVIMTIVVVAKYGNFNQSTLLTDTAYDVALVAREAQTYGLSVRNSDTGGGTNFSFPYGVAFSTQSGSSCGSATLSETNMVLFADADQQDGRCGGSDTAINTYTLSRGATVTRLCAGTEQSSCSSISSLEVSYKRPNPEAIICGTSGSTDCTYRYAEIGITGSQGGTRTIVVNQSGQISVLKQ